MEVVIHDLYEGDNRVLVRYAVRNRGSHAYDVTTPQVFSLTGARYPQSLYGLLRLAIGGSGGGAPDRQAADSGASARRARTVFPSCPRTGMPGCRSATPATRHRTHGVAFSICERRTAANFGGPGSLSHGGAINSQGGSRDARAGTAQPLRSWALECRQKACPGS